LKNKELNYVYENISKVFNKNEEITKTGFKGMKGIEIIESI
jgi:hypothetical protein